MPHIASGHPRLYFTAEELAVLRKHRTHGRHALIYRNLVHDAERSAQRTASTEWIAPLANDPVYENLYDRFWAMMSDAADLEQLAFAVAYGCDELRDAASHRLRAACGRWRAEADLRPDYGTAYATTRIVKAIAIAYDLLFAALSASEIGTIRDMLGACGGRLANDWFARADVSGSVGADAEHHSPHHASVEWSAFGILAVCMLDELPDASDWLNAAERMFTDKLLPGALAADGSHAEGTSYWASTVSSQLQFVDPLRRNGGPDLLARIARSLDPAMALAIYRPDREVTGEGEPIYSPSTAISAVLACLARELRDPELLALAAAEPTTGRQEAFPARTPTRGEQMRIAPGGYAYAWYPADLEPGHAPTRRSWYFPTAGEAYLRTGWSPDDLLASIHAAKVTVWAGPELVYQDLTPAEVLDLDRSRTIGTGAYSTDFTGTASHITSLADDGDIATVICTGAQPSLSARIVLDRRHRRVEIDRQESLERTWIVNSAAKSTVHVSRGVIAHGPTEHRPDLRVGYGLLDVIDTDARIYAKTQGAALDGRMTVIIS